MSTRAPGLALVLLAACGERGERSSPIAQTRDAPPSAAREAEAVAVDTAAIDARVASLRMVTGRVDEADEQSAWTAALDGDVLVRVDEERTRTDGARSALRHYFRDGRHRLTREVRIATMLERNGAPTVDTIVVRCGWDAFGALAAREKTIDGMPGTVQEYEADAYRVRVARLSQLALVRSAVRTP
ncbi:MAG: hypothetical protein MUF00_11490 [Gemmatimonadaceae bacterium]|nr:hypothetical protein [Gemmatimonadaceae bacterium]